MKLNFKILSVLVLTIVSTLGIFTYNEAEKQAKSLFTAEENKIRGIVVNSLGSLSVTMWNYDKEAIESTLRILLYVENIGRISIYDAEGRYYLGAAREASKLAIVEQGPDLGTDAGFIKVANSDLRQVVAPSLVTGEASRQVRATIWFSENDKDNFLGYLTVDYDVSAILKNIASAKRRSIGAALVLALLICLITFVFLRLQIIAKITKLRNASQKIAEGHYVQLPNNTAKDEVGDLTRSFNQMSVALKTYAEKMEQQVADKTRSIRYLLDLMPIGVFAVEEGGRIGEQYSAETLSILDRQDMPDLGLKAILACSSLSADKQAEVLSAVECSLGIAEIAFMANADKLVHECDYHSPLGRRKVLELSWTPVLNQAAVTEKILVTLVDATEQRRQKEREKVRSAYLQMVDELLSMGEDAYRVFMDAYVVCFQKAQDMIKQRTTLTPADLEVLFVQYHTIKGNARAYNLSKLANTVHLAEQELAQCRSHPAAARRELLAAGLARIADELARYTSLAENKLNFASPQARDFVKVRKDDLRSLLADASDSDPALLQRLRVQLLDSAGSPLRCLLSTSINSLPAIAAQAGKVTPRFIICGDTELIFAKSAAGWLQSLFNHLITNSIDHGMEGAEERRRKKKPEVGELRVDITTHGGGARCTYSDDGAGVNLTALRQRLHERHIDTKGFTHQQLLEWVFTDGISTAKEVTELSGRGVGMTAIKKIAESQGCDFRIRCLHVDQRDFASVEFIIDLPSQHLITADLSEAA